MKFINSVTIVIIILFSSCKKPSAVKITNADIVLITLSDGSLTPSFSQGTTSYTAFVDSSVASVKLTATADNADAIVTINNIAAVSGVPSSSFALNDGDNIITATVKPKDGVPAKTYTITITRAHSALSYTKSHDTWLTYRDSVNNSYTYTFDYVSAFGWGKIVTISVNGRITARDYTHWTVASGTKATDKTWHEDAPALDTHGTEGGDLLTLDQVYVKAQNVWLKVDPSKNTIYFETKNHGLISTAGYSQTGCQDDCFIGIHIISITPL